MRFPQVKIDNATKEGANQLPTNYSYDNFCRERVVTNPAGNQSTTDYYLDNVSCPSGLCANPTYSVRTKSDGAASVTTYFIAHAQ